jgi:hypothetical protein
MAEADFSELTNVASTDTITRGVTGGLRVSPQSTGRFVYAARALTGDGGALALATNGADFFPIAGAKGGEASALLMGGAAATPAIFIGAASADVGAVGYQLGLDRSGRIVLAKRALSAGLPAQDPQVVNGTAVDGVLARSTTIIPAGTFVHVRLGCRVNGAGGDVLLFASMNAAQLASSPIWSAVPGVPPIVADDLCQIFTGSEPLRGGFMGWCFTFAPGAPGAVAAVDAWRASRQA